MNAKKCTALLVSALTVLTVLIMPLGCSKDAPAGPVIPAPIIDIFSASPTDIIPPDSALLTWKTRMADSVKLFPAGQKLTPVDNGQVYIKPAVPTNYSLIAYSGGGKDSAAVSIVMSALAANIVTFRIAPDTLVNGDSSLVGWRTTQADSMVINQGIGKVNPTDTGKLTIYPMNTVTYRAVAYSIYGNDTIQINVRVKKPVLVRAIGGSYYRGVMGSTQLSPALKFAVAEVAGNFLDNLWIKLRLLQGDGGLSPVDSVLTNSMGSGDVSYNFSGQLGHAVISANFRNVDTVEVQLRANTLIPGIGGQGQYILFTDKLGDVKNFNGNPNSIDVDPNFFVTYANYESNLHVVFAINDANQDDMAQDSEDVLVVLLTDGYTGKTKDSIGVGSTYNEIKAVYGPPDTVEYDPAPPPALVFIYNSLGMVFFADTVVGNPVDTNVTIFEIHMSDFVSSPVSGKIAPKSALRANEAPLNYRRFRK